MQAALQVSTELNLSLVLFCDASVYQRTRDSGTGVVFRPWIPGQAATDLDFVSRAWYMNFLGDTNLCEAVAILEALQVAWEELARYKASLAAGRPRPSGGSCIGVKVMSDSTSVLKWLRDQAAPRFLGEGRAILDLIGAQALRIRDLELGATVEFRWCPRATVPQHILADSLANRAATSGLCHCSASNSNFTRFVESSAVRVLRAKLGVQWPSNLENAPRVPRSARFKETRIKRLEKRLLYKMVNGIGLTVQKPLPSAPPLSTEGRPEGRRARRFKAAAKLTGGDMAQYDAYYRDLRRRDVRRLRLATLGKLSDPVVKRQRVPLYEGLGVKLGEGGMPSAAAPAAGFLAKTYTWFMQLFV